MGVLNVKRWDSCDKIQIQEYDRYFVSLKTSELLLKHLKYRNFNS